MGPHCRQYKMHYQMSRTCWGLKHEKIRVDLWFSSKQCLAQKGLVGLLHNRYQIGKVFNQLQLDRYSVFVTGKLLPNFDLKNMILIYTKVFFMGKMAQIQKISSLKILNCQCPMLTSRRQPRIQKDFVFFLPSHEQNLCQQNLAKLFSG